MSLVESVQTVRQEVATLERRCEEREREVRAPVAVAEAELAAVERALAEEEVRLRQFEEEARVLPSKPVLTLARSLIAAGALGGFTWGAISSGHEVTKQAVGLLAAVWIAFLAGALRGR